jgi:preprotein translocase subunit YajC
VPLQITRPLNLAFGRGFPKVSDRFSNMHLNFFSGMLADVVASAPATVAAGQPQQPSLIMQMAPMLILLVVFYFILIRPQQQRQKQQLKLLSALKAGDRVVTASGIIGTVITVKDKAVSLRSADAKFEITKASVTEILEAGTATETKIP